MVSFFRKKKKSAQAKAKDANAAAAKTSGSVVLPPPASSVSVSSSESPVSTASAPLPASPSSSQQQQPNSSPTAKRTASLPTKRRNFLAGSLRGSRSSVSRLPAVQEEIGSHPSARRTPPRSSSSTSTPIQSQQQQQQHNQQTQPTVALDATSTPSTASVSTPDLLGSLSFDDQQEGQVEILTPNAKDQVKKQLNFGGEHDHVHISSPALRTSRITSMEVSAEGIVSQISQEEDADILLGTTNTTNTTTTTTTSSTKQSSTLEPVHRAASNATASTTSTNSQQMAQEFANKSQAQSPPRSSLAPKPNSSPIFMKIAEEHSDPEDNDNDQGDGEEQEDEASRNQYYHTTPSSKEVVAAANAAAKAITPDEPFGYTTGPVPPTRTISLENDRLNLVSPLTMHPITRSTSKEEDHHHHHHGHPPMLEQQISQEETDEDTWEEAEDTITDTVDNTYDSNPSRNDWTKGYDENNPMHQMERQMQQVAQSLMNSLQCTPERMKRVADNPIQGTMSMFYDGMCRPEDLDENPRRPYFNEEFAQRFVKRMLTNGMSLLYLQPPHTTSNPSDEWKGRTVVMKIVPGSTGAQDAIQPKLQWTTMPGGTVPKAYMTTLSLLRIHSVLTANQNIVPQESTTLDLNDDDMCFISITSAAGKIFLFEANSVRERDEIANGLRNVIARLSFHLVAGDHQASTELYNDDRAIQEEAEPGDLPALANPKLNMNRMTHLLMEA